MSASLLLSDGGPARAAVAWLLTYAVHSSVLLGGVWLATRRRATPEPLQDVLWKAALWGGVLTATLQSATGWRPVTGLELRDVPAVAAARPAAPPASVSAAPAPAVSAAAAVAAPAGLARPSIAAPAPAAVAVAEAPAGGGAGWQALLLALWAAGAALSLGRLGVARARLRSGLAPRTEIEGGELPRMVAELCRAGGVRSRVRLTCSEHVATPVALGAAEICVPPDALTRLEREHQRSMLAHELAHLVRRDPLWLAATAVLERVFFFQPLNALGRRRLQEVSEYLCDDWAIRLTGSGVTLARCLSAVAGWVAPRPRALPLAGMAESGSPLVRRVERLLEDAPRSSAFTARPARLLVAGVVVAMVGLFAPGVYAASRAAAAPGPQAAARPRVHAAPSAAPTAVVSRPERRRAAPPAAGERARALPAAAEAGAAAAAAAPPCWRPEDRAAVTRNMVLAGGEYQVVWTRGGCTVRLSARGALEANDAETDLKSLAPGGSFVLEETAAGRTRRVEITSDAAGRLARAWTVDGAPRPWGDEARAWLAGAIPDVLRFTGIGAGPRSQAILQRRGRAGLLREIALVHGDEARTTYLRTLTAAGGLDAATGRQVLRETAAIGSDRRKADLVLELFRGPLRGDAALLPDLLDVAAGISSDSYLAGVLTAVAAAHPLDAPAQASYLRAAGTLGADSYRRGVLAALLRSGGLGRESLMQVLEAARTIGSDGQLSALLVQLAGGYPVADGLRDQYLRAADTIASASLRQRALDALGPAGR